MFALILLTVNLNAFASEYIYGRVLYVEPVYQEIYRNTYENSRLVCNNTYIQRDRTADTVLGAIIGGAVGRQFGSGDGRDAATVAGALIGGSIAHNRGRDGYYSGRQCYWDDSYRGYRNYRTYDRYPNGYDVTYTINGRDRYTIRMSYDPGSTVRIRVD